MIKNPEPTLITAGGKIKCRRCTAKSSYTKQQCKRPALKSSKTSKCSCHGGKSTGPRTQEGKDRISAAHWKTGSFTKEAIAERKSKFAKLNELAMTLGINHKKD
jgi:hypothetical protein